MAEQADRRRSAVDGDGRRRTSVTQELEQGRAWPSRRCSRASRRARRRSPPACRRTMTWSFQYANSAVARADVHGRSRRRARPRRLASDASRSTDSTTLHADVRELGAASRTKRCKINVGQDRGEVRRRRVPDPDPVGEGSRRASRTGSSSTATRSPTVPSRCCGRTSRRARSSSSRRSIRRRCRWSTAAPRCRRCGSTTTARSSRCRSASAWRTRRASRT